jgi:hypothetical protein
LSKENAIVLRSVARPDDAFSWAEPDSGGSRNVWFPDIRMSGFAPRASSDHQCERGKVMFESQKGETDHAR